MVSDGYTFTSPSVYVIYTRLLADETCYSGLWSYDLYTNGSYSDGSWSNVSWKIAVQVGSMYTRVTRAYAPEALSTGGVCQNTRWATINYTQLYSPEPDYMVATEAACSKPFQHYSKGEVTDASFGLAGSPLLSIPPDLSLIDPSWSTCTAERLGGFDPPRALAAAMALIPDPTAVPDPSTRAEAASSPIHPLPAQTLTAKPDPPTQTPGLGAIIYNAFGKSGPQVDRSSPSFLPPQSIFTIDAQTFTANPTGFKVNNAAIVPGGTAQTVDGIKISLDPSGVLAIGISTISLTDPPATPLSAVADQTFTLNPSAFYVADSIISADDPAITISGNVISLDQSGALAISSSTIDLLTPSDTSYSRVYIAADQSFTPNPSDFIIAGTAISADVPAVTIGGTIISLDGEGGLKIDSSTSALPNSSNISPTQVYTVAGQIFTPNPSAFSIADTTISAGGPPVTVDGTIISLGRSGTLAIGSSTVDLSTLSYTPSGAYTVADQVFTPNPSAFSIAGTTISAGGPAVTLDGTAVSLQPSGNLIVGSSTIPLLTPQAAFSSDINIDGFDVKAGSSFDMVDGVTLSAGAADVTISGQVVSLEAGGATLDIGTGRFALPTPMGAANGSINVQAFTGGQSKGLKLSLSLVCGICGTLMLLT